MVLSKAEAEQIRFKEVGWQSGQNLAVDQIKSHTHKVHTHALYISENIQHKLTLNITNYLVFYTPPSFFNARLISTHIFILILISINTIIVIILIQIISRGVGFLGLCPILNSAAVWRLLGGWSGSHRCCCSPAPSQLGQLSDIVIIIIVIIIIVIVILNKLINTKIINKIIVIPNTILIQVFAFCALIKPLVPV